MNNFLNAVYQSISKSLRVSVVQSDGTNVDSFGGVSTPSTIGHGSKNVATAGTPLALSTSTTCKRVMIQAKSTNTGLIAVGGATVVAAVGATQTGRILQSNDSIEIQIDDLAKVYIDSTVNGEGVTYAYFN